MQIFANDLETVIRSTYDHPLHDIWPLWYWLIHLQDSLQAFSSSIAGLLSSRAVLQGNVAHALVPTGSIVVTSRVWQITDQHGSVGVGVGDASASPTAALLLSVIQESTGRIATILFAHRLGTSLEPECKMYRLAADVFNDTAMIFDCLSPALPKAPRVILLSLSSVLRALCGVAAGSSKASLSAHFAKWGNLGELNAVSPPIFFREGGQVSKGKDMAAIPIPVQPRLQPTKLHLNRPGMFVDFQAEGLEPRNDSLANGVRTFRKLLRAEEERSQNPCGQIRGMFSLCVVPTSVLQLKYCFGWNR